MRALFLTPNLGAGGAERQLSMLLPALRARGIDARIIGLDGGGPFVAPLREAGVPVEILGMRHQLDLTALRRSPLLRTFAPDVVVSIGVSGLYIGEAVAGLRGAAHVYTEHRGVGVELSRRRESMMRALARRLDRVIVVSDDQQASWLRYGCSPERVLTIRNGVAPVAVTESPAAIRRELGVPEDAVAAVMLASLKPLKRVGDFVASARAAREQLASLHAVVAGDGPERADVARAAAGDPGLHLLGHRDDTSRLLHAADLLVLCSDFEAAPMAILEGMAAGLPVIASRVGAIPELVADGDSGILIEPRDRAALTESLLRLAGDRELRAAMGAAGRARAERDWSLDAMVDRYAEVLEAAVQSRARKRTGPVTTLSERYLRALDERGWVTWERTVAGAQVLQVTNAWPDREFPMRGTFARATVDGLSAAGVRSDVLYVRGYLGPHVYLAASLAMFAVALSRRRSYRLVHSHGGETALVARCFAGAPVLASYWGNDILGDVNLRGERLGSARARLKLRVVSAVLRAHAGLLSATTTKSAEMEDRLPARTRRRNRVIPDGVDRTVFAPGDRTAARQALGWPQSETIVITVGRPDPLKRVELAQQAAELARRELPTLRWRAVSDLPGELMPAAYNGADLLLHTSATEGSPNAVKEALACNLPVVATPSGDIPELLQDVHPSVIAPAEPAALAQAILTCLRAQTRSNGRAQSGNVSLPATTAQTLALYAELGLRPPT